MLGDRNIFAVESYERRVRSEARELDAARSLDPLEAARALLVDLERERNRIVLETWGNAWIVDDLPYDGFIAVIDDFVSGTFARMEARAVAGEEGIADRLLVTMQRILAGVRGVSPASEHLANVVQTVVDTANDARDAAKDAGEALVPILLGVALVLVLVVVVKAS